MYVVGLGLCTFANIASEEMSRDLANEIEKLLGSSNTYIRKKVSSPSRRVCPLIHPSLSGCPLRLENYKEGPRPL